MNATPRPNDFPMLPASERAGAAIRLAVESGMGLATCFRRYGAWYVKTRSGIRTLDDWTLLYVVRGAVLQATKGAAQ